MMMAMLLLLFAALAPTAAAAHDDDLECEWRKLAVEFAVAQVGPHVAVPVQEALAGSISGDLPVPVHCDYPPTPPAAATQAEERPPWLSAATQVLHVAPNPATPGDGSEAKPYTLLEAKAAVLAAPAGRRPATTLLLADGTYRLEEPLEFGPEDGGLEASATVTYAAAPGATPIISGAALVPSTSWIVANATLGVADLASSSITDQGEASALWVQGRRFWPARYPNGDPATCLAPNCYDTNCSWGENMPVPNGTYLTNLSQPYRNNTQFPSFTWAEGGWTDRYVGGACYDPGDHHPDMKGSLNFSLSTHKEVRSLRLCFIRVEETAGAEFWVLPRQTRDLQSTVGSDGCFFLLLQCIAGDLELERSLGCGRPHAGKKTRPVFNGASLYQK